MMELLLTGIDANDRKFIEEFCGKVIDAVLEEQDLLTYFNNKFYFWIDKIDETLNYLDKKHCFLREKQNLYFKYLKKPENVFLSFGDIQEYRKKINLSFINICEEEINLLNKKLENLIQLATDINFYIDVVKNIFLLTEYHIEQYYDILKCILDCSLWLKNNNKVVYMEITNKINAQVAFLPYELLKDIKLSIDMLKEHLTSLKEGLKYIRSIFETNCEMCKQDFAFKMVENYLFECFYTKCSTEYFTKIMSKYIDAVDNTKRHEKKFIEA